MAINKEIINIIFWKWVEIILAKRFVGKKPPPDIKDILKFNELKSLIPDILKSKNIPKLRTQ